MGTVTRGRGIFAALLMVVLGVGLLSPIGWAQDATPDVDTLDQICATLEASPASPDASPVGGDATPAIATPESATPDAGLVDASPEASPDASPAADLEAELCGTSNA